MKLVLLLASILLLPVWKEDTAPELAAEKRAQLEQVDRLVTAAAKGDGKVRAAVLTLGNHESRFSLRIMRSECRPKECDPYRTRDGRIVHRARGTFQMQRQGMTDDEWASLLGPDSLPAQVKIATRRVRGALHTCRGDVRGAFAVLGGRGCAGTLPDMGERLATYKKLGGW